MNKNVLIVLAGGFVVAILVAVLVQASLGGKKVDNTVASTQVLVASKDLPLGKELAPGDLKWQTWQGEQAFNGAIVRKTDEKPEDVLTGRLISRVASGQPVLKNYIFKEGKGNLVAASLGKGMRAVAIPVKADTMAGGFVTPGDYVDVIMSFHVTTNSRENPSVQSLVSKSASETVLSNIKVLAVDQEATRSDDEDKAKIARTVTLEVSSQGAEKLALASDMGDLTLALRGIGDTSQSDNGITTDVHVSKVMQDVARIEGGGGSIRIYNGDKMEEARTRGAGGMITDKKTTNDNSGEQTGEDAADEDPAEGDR